MGKLLADRTILVPAARVGQDVLAAILRRQGAVVRTFPELAARPPADPEPMGRAIDELEGYNWIVFAGELGARSFLDRWGERGPLPAKTAAIGKGARKELKARDQGPDSAPREHTAGAVADALGDLDGARVLLIRGDRASSALPEELGRRGARATDLVGFEVALEVTAEGARAALAPPLEMLALGNPSAVRFFSAALRELDLDLELCLAGVVVAAVGPVTARVAAERGLEPDLVAQGHLADLMKELKGLWG